MTAPDLTERIDIFKSEVRSLSTVKVIRKHIIHGGCFVLPQYSYFDLKSEVADHFEMHPNDVLVVGSAKLGFSIAPKKRYREFHDESDIDVVLVSPLLFDKVWEAVFNYWKSGSYWERHQKFKDYLFRGWIRPDLLPPSRMFSIGEDWWEFFRSVTRSGRYGDYKISGALYKSWHYLESYQTLCVDSCREELMR